MHVTAVCYVTEMRHSVCMYVFVGPTNVEDPVQLLMKDAGESNYSLTPGGWITVIISQVY